MRRPFSSTFVPVAIGLMILGCTPIAPSSGAPQTGNEASTATTTLNVSAAASLTEAFSEIGADFAAAHPGADVVFNFAGSNQLAAQIGAGAPVDVFASANNAQMNIAVETGRIISGTQQTFARNRLVVITPSDNPAGLSTLQDLAQPGVKIVFAASEVPVGQYTLDFLDKAAAEDALGAGYKEAVIANVVSYEADVRAVLTKVSLGEADAGIVYKSDVGAAADEVVQIEIPDHLNTIATYPIAALHDSPHLEPAQQFVDFVLGPQGQQVLADYGFVAAQ